MSIRKLTRKSTLGFGKYSSRTIQEIIDEDPLYVVWVYYNGSEITFFDDILDEVGLVGEFTIDKPGTNPDKFFEDEERKKLKRRSSTDQERGMNRKTKFHEKKSAKKRESKWESKASFKSKSMGNPMNF